MKRFSTPILSVLIGLAVLLVLVAALLVMRQPIQAVLAEKLSGQTGNSAQGRRFDADFGSLSDLVPPVSGGQVLEPAAADQAEGAGHGEQFHDLSWLKSQPQDGYTLQVLGARNEEAVTQFIAGQKDPAQFSYFQSQQDGQPWFVVVFGSYGSREQALGVADTLDTGLGSRPFPKRFGAYVTEILAQAQPAQATGSSAPAPAPAANSAPEPAP